MISSAELLVREPIAMLGGPQISKHTYKFIKQCLTFQPTFPPTPQKGLVEKPIGKDSRTC